MANDDLGEIAGPLHCRRRSACGPEGTPGTQGAEAPVTSRLQSDAHAQSQSRRARYTCHQPRGLIRVCSPPVPCQGVSLIKGLLLVAKVLSTNE